MIAQKTRLRPTPEDFLRALAYGVVVVWTILFAVYPPVSYVDSLDVITRMIWIGACTVGALAAFFGAIFRIDLKLELPGIAVMLIGPLFYTAAQVWFVMNPPLGSTPDARIALVAYASLPIFFCLPRMYSLYAESRRSSILRKDMQTLVGVRLEEQK